MRSLAGARLPRLVAEAEDDLLAALSGRGGGAMMFLDEATIRVTAGTGGSGCMSFRRETFVPKGGPDGGDGGNGGSVYARVNGQMSTLLDYQYRTHWKAERAQHGMGANKTGKSSDDVYLPVPPGTVIQDADSGAILGELVEPGEELLLARGGGGGHAATRDSQPPRTRRRASGSRARRVRTGGCG
jgi:GTP-binding protein